jgi:tetratricopeptide (TPR) repeat protein
MKRSSLMIAGIVAALVAGLPLDNSTRAGSPTSNAIEQKLFFQAEAKFRQGRSEMALPDLKQVLQINPKHPGAIFYAGMYEYEKGRLTRARRFFVRISDDPEYGVKARTKLAEMAISAVRHEQIHSIDSYLSGDAIDQAKQEVEQAVLQSPQSPELLFQQVLTSCLTEDFGKAREALEKLKATHSGPRQEELELFVHAWQHRRETPGEALEILLTLKDKTILLDRVRREIVSLLTLHAEDSVGEEYLLRELAARPESRGVLIPALVQYYQNRGLFEKGLQLLETSGPDSLPDSPQYFRLLAQTGRSSQALLSGIDAMTDRPDEVGIPLAWLEIFDTWSESSENQEQVSRENHTRISHTATHLLRRLLDQETRESLEAGTALLGAKIALRLGNPIDAQAFIHLLEERDLPAEALPALVALARHLLTQNLPETAERLLAKARLTFPEDPDLTIISAQALWQGKQSLKARHMLATVDWEKIRDLESLSLYLKTLEQSGQPGTARNIVLQILNRPTLSPLLQQSLKAIAHRLPEWDYEQEAATD